MITITSTTNQPETNLVISRDRGPYYECVNEKGVVVQVPKSSITSTKTNTRLRLPEIISFSDRPRSFLSILRDRRLNVMQEFRKVMVKFEGKKEPTKRKSPTSRKKKEMSPKEKQIQDRINAFLEE